MDQDIRWIQRFSNYCNALKRLRDAVNLSKERSLSELEKQGLIQCFEYTQELSWKTLKDFLEEQGGEVTFASKDVIRQAFRLSLLKEGEIWMDMIKSRNLTSHIYDEKVVNQITEQIIHLYFPQFEILAATLEREKEKAEDPLP